VTDVPMSPQQVERKLGQLDNDVQSIYEMLSTITSTQQRHSNRFNELAEQVGGLEIKVDAHDARFDSLEAKVDSLEAKVDGLEAKVDGIGAKVDTVLDLLRAR
jgi:chromosome segregation ATPase